MWGMGVDETITWLVPHISAREQDPVDFFIQGWLTNVSVFVTLSVPQFPSLAVHRAAVDDGSQVRQGRHSSAQLLQRPSQES